MRLDLVRAVFFKELRRDAARPPQPRGHVRPAAGALPAAGDRHRDARVEQEEELTDDAARPVALTDPAPCRTSGQLARNRAASNWCAVGQDAGPPDRGSGRGEMDAARRSSRGPKAQPIAARSVEFNVLARPQPQHGGFRRTKLRKLDEAYQRWIIEQRLKEQGRAGVGAVAGDDDGRGRRQQDAALRAICSGRRCRCC